MVGNILFDFGRQEIVVKQKIYFKNLTAQYGAKDGYARPLGQSEFDDRVKLIFPGIMAWWNEPPYMMRIRIRGGPEYRMKIIFNPARVFSESESDCRIDTYNMPCAPVHLPNGSGTGYEFYAGGVRGVNARQLPLNRMPYNPTNGANTLGRSWVSDSAPIGAWNLGDFRSCTETVPGENQGMNKDMLEPHEYAHMLGFKDVYNPNYADGFVFHTSGDQGIPGDDHEVSFSRGNVVTSILGSMNPVANHHRADALPVAKVVSRHIRSVWNLPIEEWELSL